MLLEVRIPVIDDLVGGVEIKHHGGIDGEIQLANDRAEDAENGTVSGNRTS